MTENNGSWEKYEIFFRTIYEDLNMLGEKCLMGRQVDCVRLRCWCVDVQLEEIQDKKASRKENL